MPNLINQILLNQYRVDSFIASGGMGAVYKVWDLKRSAPLAMKVLHAELMDDPSAFKHFQREAQTLEQLRHPHIVPFYGLHHTAEFPFMVEQFIDGSTLRDVLRKYPGGMSFNAALPYIKALCSALGYAHVNGLVHCDIKPGNVMVDQGGQIYLADFGIVRHAESVTSTIAGSGTPAYMAPEQIMRQPVTPATDIYALGVVLFEMLTGQRPFRGDEPETLAYGNTSGERIIYAHLNLVPRDPARVNPTIPRYVADVILKAMSKAPQERFASTNEMLAALGLDSYEVPNRATSHTAPQPLTPGQAAPRGSQINWLIPLGVVGLVLIVGLFCFMTVNLSGKNALAVNIQATLMAQARTEVRLSEPAPANTFTPAPLLPTATMIQPPAATATRKAPPTKKPNQPGVTLLDPSRVSEFAGAQSLKELAEEHYTASDYHTNETLNFTVNLNGSQPVMWKANWCAKRKAILTDNLQKIEIHFFLNGSEIPLNKFAGKQYINKDGGLWNGWSCVVYQAVLTNWQTGTYQVMTKFIYRQAINDGKDSYPAGWQASLYNVTVR